MSKKTKNENWSPDIKLGFKLAQMTEAEKREYIRKVQAGEISGDGLEDLLNFGKGPDSGGFGGGDTSGGCTGY